LSVISGSSIRPSRWMLRTTSPSSSRGQRSGDRHRIQSCRIGFNGRNSVSVPRIRPRIRPVLRIRPRLIGQKVYGRPGKYRYEHTGTGQTKTIRE
jgi:hypothetical protein